MKRALQRIYWVGIALTLGLVMVTLAGFVILRVQDTRENLQGLLSSAAAWTMVSGDSLQAQADSIAEASPPLRVTFLMSNGLVLADSQADALTMETHLDRPEVRRALENGTGESLRLSDTQHTFEMYMARMVGSQLILRLSYPVREITRILFTYAVVLLTLAVVLFLLQRRMLGRFTQALMQQMDDVRRLMEGSQKPPRAVFPELQGAMNDIAFRANRLNDDLREVSRTLTLRNDFVANASHEIRSPLTSIMGFAEMLEEGLADTPEEQMLCIRSIRAECGRMLDVVEDILLLSRAERQKNVQTSAVCLEALAEEVLQALSMQASEKGVTLALEGSLTREAVEKDMWEILCNLVDNAIRYGKRGGHVWVRLEEERITVEDDGIGIAPQHVKRIFEQFYRVDETRDTSARGTGLGLSIVRSLAERNGGSIRVESEPGKGSRFIIDFDCKEAPENA